MAPTAAQIAQLRRMVNEPTIAVYTDEILIEVISQYPLMDYNGVETPDAAWIPTYDMHAAAQDIWESKAAVLQSNYDFSADTSSFSISQQYEQAMDQARSHGARRRPSSRRSIKWPIEPATIDIDDDSQSGNQ